MIFQPNLVVRVLEHPDSEFTKSPSSYVTHHVGHNNYPLTTSRTSLVYQAHFSGGKPFSGSVKKLTFFQLENGNVTDMSTYSKTCKSIVFNGHIRSLYTAMEIIRQLPQVTKVAFLIGERQQGNYFECFDEFFGRTPLCSHVEKLKVFMGLDFPHGNSRTTGLSKNHLNINQQSLITLAECILKHSIDSFPNLKNLDVDVPDFETLRYAVKNLIFASPGLRSKKYPRIQRVPSIVGSGSETCSSESDGSNNINKHETSHQDSRMLVGHPSRTTFRRRTSNYKESVQNSSFCCLKNPEKQNRSLPGFHQLYQNQPIEECVAKDPDSNQ